MIQHRLPRSLVTAWAACAVLFAVGAVSFAPHVDAARPVQAASAAPREDVPADWTRVDTGPFSVALPPGWRYDKRQGVDSFVGRLVGDGIALTFDLGAYWNSPPVDESGYDVVRERIDFRAAEIYRPRDPSDIIGLFIEHTDDFGSSIGPTHLSIVGRAALEAQDVVLRLFRSIRFRRLIGDEGRWVEVAPPAGKVALLDLDRRHGSSAWIVGVRYLTATVQASVFQPTSATLQATVFEPTADGWAEHVLQTGEGSVPWAVAGDWAATNGALFHYDAEAGRWARERVVASGNLVMDIAVDAGYDGVGWAIGTDNVIRLAGGRSTEADGGWGTASGLAIDVLPRRPLVSRATVPSADALAIGGTGAAAFDGRRWWDVPWDVPNFAGLGVDVVAAGEAWIVGTDERAARGAIRHRLGAVTTAVPVTTSRQLWSVDLLSPAEGWAVGGSTSGQGPAELWRFRDGVWERQPSPCIGLLKAVQAMPNGEAWAVGLVADGPLPERRGIVLHYVPVAHRLWLPWSKR